MNEKTIVISAYNENLKWCNRITRPNTNIIIIDKGNSTVLPDIKLKEYIKLENIGREAHSFSYYLSNMFSSDDCSDSFMFLQGNPFDHCPDVLYHINSDSLLGEYMELTNNHFPLSDWDRGRHLCTADLLEILLDTKWPLPVYNFPCGAQSYITKNVILNRPSWFWKILLNNFPWKTENMIPYLMERLWPFLFDINIKQKTKEEILNKLNNSYVFNWN